MKAKPVNAYFYYLFYVGSCDQFSWSTREDDEEFYNHVVNGTHVECEYICGALVDSRHSDILETLLKSLEADIDSQIKAIKVFSEFI